MGEMTGTTSTARSSFYRKNRKGKVLKLVRESYLRDDLGFGYRLGSRLSIEDVKELLRVGEQKSLLVLDTNVALQEIDLLEYDSEKTKSAFSVVVVLETVLKEVKHLNVSAYRRLKGLLEREDKTFVFFPNEVATATRVEKESDESINDANDRAIREASLYYQQALGGQHGSVIMLTKDRDNRAKAARAQLAAMGVQQYITSLGGASKFPQLMELVASDGSSGSMSKMSVEYPAHLAAEEINEGIRKGTLFRGVLRCRGRGGTAIDNWTDCYAGTYSVILFFPFCSLTFFLSYLLTYCLSAFCDTT
jgi:exosome complex exonuclease DIS3/RRP44